MRKVKITLIAIIALVVLAGKNVYAKDIYYTNSSGVSFTKEEYDFFTYMTWDGYQEYVTQDMVDEIQGKTIHDPDVKKVSLCPSTKKASGNVASTRSSNLEVTTDTKSLTLGKYCTPYFCRVMMDLLWFDEPYIKSHDVVGSLLDGPTRLTNPTTLVATPSTTASHLAAVYDTDGFGTVVKLPDTTEQIHITQSYMYSGTGVIYYTYQHSMFTISLANAQLFNIDIIGYGNVLDFYGAATGFYDAMPGVYVEV